MKKRKIKKVKRASKKRVRVLKTSKKKVSKKVVKKSKPAKKSSSFKKRRKKEIYDFHFSKNPKTEKEIDSIIDSINFRKIKSSNEFIKITFVEKKNRKDQQSFTHLGEYDYDSLAELQEQIKQQCRDMNYTFWRVPAAKSKNYWKKMYRLKTYLNRIIIDFETAD